MKKECQTRYTRTIDLITYFRENMRNDDYLAVRLHTILCMTHAFDSTAIDVFSSLIDDEIIAKAIDEILNGNKNFDVFKLKEIGA